MGNAASTNPTSPSRAHVTMIASNPEERYRGVSMTGERAYPMNLALLNTEDDVPFMRGGTATTIVRREDHTKEPPIPEITRSVTKPT